MLEFVKVEDDSSVRKFIDIAAKVWHEYFPFLLSEEQIDYMLDKFQSFEAVKKQQNNGYEYYFILKEGEIVGYTVFALENDYLFLSKLYFLKGFRGKGFGCKTLEFLKDKAKMYGVEKIKLTVNKYNENSIKAYQKWGFEIVDSKVFDIGEGYVMDDYIMQKVI